MEPDLGSPFCSVFKKTGPNLVTFVPSLAEQWAYEHFFCLFFNGSERWPGVRTYTSEEISGARLDICIYFRVGRKAIEEQSRTERIRLYIRSMYYVFGPGLSGRGEMEEKGSLLSESFAAECKQTFAFEFSGSLGFGANLLQPELMSSKCVEAKKSQGNHCMTHEKRGRRWSEPALIAE